jgi:ATP-dependent 26S proteasome regulatory subunit
MQISKLDLLLKSGIPVVCVAAPLCERITVLELIYQEIAVNKNIPLYVWNAGWGCFKKFKSDSQTNNFYHVTRRIKEMSPGEIAPAINQQGLETIPRSPAPSPKSNAVNFPELQAINDESCYLEKWGDAYWLEKKREASIEKTDWPIDKSRGRGSDTCQDEAGLNIPGDMSIGLNDKTSKPASSWGGQCDGIKPPSFSEIRLGEPSIFRQAPESAVAAFDCLLSYDGEGIFIFENLPSLIKEILPGYFGISSRIISQIINTFYELSKCELAKYVILMTTDDTELPQSLCDLIPTLSTPLPSFEEVASYIQIFLTKDIKLPGEFEISSVVHAARGLTIEEIRIGCALAFHSGEEITTQTLASHLLSYKISRFLAFNLNFIPSPNVPDFGGLDLLKDFIKKAKIDFSGQARDANIPLPKGVLLVGPPGTGKTLAANVSARELGFPLISIDTGAVAAGGATYLKRLLTRVEACAPVVLYFDEFDKLFAANSVTGELDSSNKQILGTLLTWLQDKHSPVFVVATLNRLDALPPELTRVGRFDEIFYVGFPTAIERKEILTLHLARFDQRYSNGGNPLSQKEWRVILNKTVNCTGAELARMVEKAARCQFHQGREILIGLAELLKEREAMVPLYVRDTDRILAIENRARYFTQPSSSPDDSEYAPAITTFWGNSQNHRTKLI